MVETRSNRWTPREDALFRRMAEANTRPEVIAAKLNRSVRAITARAYRIGLPLKWSKLKAKGKQPEYDLSRYRRPTSAAFWRGAPR